MPFHSQSNDVSVPKPGSKESVSEYLIELRAAIASWTRTAIRSCPEENPLPADSEFEFNRLACALFSHQYDANPIYRSWCRSRGASPQTVREWREVPALPVSAFKEAEVSCLKPGGSTTVFQSSGTTGQTPSRHFHDARSLEVYQASFTPWFEFNALTQWEGGLRAGDFDWVSLIPSSTAAPHSSLAWMIDSLLGKWAGDQAVRVGRVGPEGEWQLDAEALIEGLDRSVRRGRPAFLFGTAFNWVHLFDALEQTGTRFRLPPGSRVMETGGYKGRSRILSAPELAQGIESSIGIPATSILTEYGMSELSSQAYARWQDQTGAGVLRFPAWARGLVVSPETGLEVEEGETGLLRLVDLANVASVLCLQTEDLAVRRGRDFQLLGRRPAAEARGCSLMSV